MRIAQIKPVEFDGLKAVELSTTKAKMVVIHEVGPRIAHFGTASGRNLLFWDTQKKYKRGDWRLRGGHRVWATRPLADEAEETYADDNRPCKYTLLKNGISITAGEHPVHRIRKSLVIKVLSEDTFSVENRITNVGDMLWSGGAWGLTCTLPGKRSTYGIPLGDNSRWDVFSLVIPRRWAGEQTSRVNDPQLSFTQDCLVINPRGIQSKRMIQASQGIIGMTDSGEGVSFLKKSGYEPGADYPLNTNIAFYIGPKNFMVEMETMSPERFVKPGDSVTNIETWALRPPVDWKKVGKEGVRI